MVGASMLAMRREKRPWTVDLVRWREDEKKEDGMGKLYFLLIFMCFFLLLLFYRGSFSSRFALTVCASCKEGVWSRIC